MLYMSASILHLSVSAVFPDRRITPLKSKSEVFPLLKHHVIKTNLDVKLYAFLTSALDGRFIPKERAPVPIG
jgi:hypothetical protein